MAATGLTMPGRAGPGSGERDQLMCPGPNSVRAGDHAAPRPQGHDWQLRPVGRVSIRIPDPWQ
jgi:hypothetical protein